MRGDDDGNQQGNVDKVREHLEEKRLHGVDDTQCNGITVRTQAHSCMRCACEPEIVRVQMFLNKDADWTINLSFATWVATMHSTCMTDTYKIRMASTQLAMRLKIKRRMVIAAMVSKRRWGRAMAVAE
jgi:hypothetical protein